MGAMKNTGVAWIGEIPSEWELGKVKYGFDRKKEKSTEKDPVVLSLARAGVRVRDISTNEGQLAASYEGYNSVEPNDLLLNPMDLISGANCSISHVSGVISPAYMNLRARNGFDPRYYDYFFKTQYWSLALFAHGKGVSFDNRWTLNESTLRDYFIPMPSYQEQQAIADYLDDRCSKIDEIIAEATASIEEYKELKQAVIFEAVTKGLDKNVPMKDSGFDFIGEIPANWEMCKVRHIGSPQNGISFGGDAYGDGYPFVSYGDVYRNFSLPKQIKGLIQSSDADRERYSVQKGDIFFTRTSETKEEIGFSSVCEETIPNAVFAGFLIRVRPFNDKLDTGFAKYYFRSNHLRAYFVKEMNLVIRASLGQELLKGAPVLLPPKEEQRWIADFLDKNCALIDSTISEKESVISDLQAYKKSLIYEVVTGKRRVV